MSYLDEKDANQRIDDLVNFWQRRTLKIKEWYRLRERVDTYKKEKYESVASNDPKNFFNLSQYLLSALPAKHRIPITVQEKEQKDKIGKTERALVSIWREKDEQMLRGGKRPWRWQLADFLLITGWYSVFGTLLEANGKPMFMAKILNPMNTFQAWDDMTDELTGFVHQYQIPYYAAERMRLKEGWTWKHQGKRYSSSDMVTVSNFWRMEDLDEVYNTIHFDKYQVKPDVHMEDFKRIPILTGPAGGEAAWGGYETGDSGWVERYGESILEPNAEMYDKQNRWLSFIMQITRENAQPFVIARTKGGRVVLKKEDIENGGFIHIDTDESIGPMREPRFHEELNNIQGIIEQKLQQGSFPHALYGAVPPALDLSGYAIGLLMTASQNVVAPAQNAMTHVMQMIDRAWLEGYKDSDLGTIEISGRLGDKKSSGLFHEEFGPDDVPDCTYVDVTVPLATPSDFLERITIARQARPLGDLLDKTTVLDEVLDVEDPELIKERLDEDAFVDSGVYKALQMVKEMKEYSAYLRGQGKNDEADILDQVTAGVIQSMVAPAAGVPSPPRPGVPPEVGGAGQTQQLRAQEQGR